VWKEEERKSIKYRDSWFLLAIKHDQANEIYQNEGGETYNIYGGKK
jgi:hypothetical protein